MNQESLQLGFHMRSKIDYFDIVQDISNKMIFVNLHYPTSTLASMVNLIKIFLKKLIKTLEIVYINGYISQGQPY